ncbi:MAG TPA: FAD/NAD(P)-binding oxidoreductase [Dehalococcoidia bacterium]
MAVATSTAAGAAATRTGLRHEIVVIGGGNAGISVAARLCRALRSPDVAIIEPSDKHYYQPLWTLVGGGVFPKERSVHSEASVIPPAANWIRDSVAEVRPDENLIVTAEGRAIGYDYLIVAPGIQIDWAKVKGLPEALGKDGVCSNYSYESVDKTWEFIRGFNGGNAVFTQPSTPVKCGGAPQKIAYLADDHFRKAGVRAGSNVIFASGGASIFSVPRYANTLNRVINRKGIEARFRRDLVEVRSATREAVFLDLDSGETVVQPYDLLHVTPPMSAPDFIKASPLANEAGWVDVDKNTLQHVRYPNVFSLGDASSLPTSKTGSAIRKQAPVVVDNLLALMSGKPLAGQYDGYTACPLVTGYGRLVLAEFDYDLKPRETFPFDQSTERRSMYLFKAYGLPALYWHGIMPGRV